MIPANQYRGTQLQAHDVESITLEDGVSENGTRWIRLFFHRRGSETIQIVAFPEEQSRTLRVDQPGPKLVKGAVE